MTVSAFSQPVFQATLASINERSNRQILEEALQYQPYQIFLLDTDSLDNFLQQISGDTTFSLAITANWTWQLTLSPYDMQGSDNLPIITYRGIAGDTSANRVALTATNDYLSGTITYNNKRYRIGPAWGILGDDYVDHFVVVETPYTPPSQQENTPGGILEIGVEVDYELYQAFNQDEAAIHTRVMAFMSEIELYYQDHFDNLSFKVNGPYFQYASDNFYGTTNEINQNISNYWRDFRDCIPRDVIILFSGSNIGFGHANMGACPDGTSLVPVSFVSTTTFYLNGITGGFQGMVIAHELGHVLTGTGHVDDDSGYCVFAAGDCENSSNQPLMCTSGANSLIESYLDICTINRITQKLEEEGFEGSGCLSDDRPVPELPCPNTDCIDIQITADNLQPIIGCEDQDKVNYTITICDVCPDEQSGTWDIVVESNGVTETLLSGGDFTDVSIINGIRYQRADDEFFEDGACKIFQFSIRAVGEASIGNPVTVKVKNGVDEYSDDLVTNPVSPSDLVHINGAGATPARLSTSTLLLPPNADCSLSGGTQIIRLSGVLEIDLDNLSGVSCYNFKPGSVIQMGADAKIVVKGGALQLNGVKILSCTDLWDRISVEDGASIQVVECLIQDAKYAIEAKDGASLDIQLSIFRNNHIGIYTPALTNPYLTQTVDMIQCYGNVFETTGGGLKSPFEGQKGLAGIWMSNQNAMVIGLEDAVPNYFRNLQNGIAAFYSNVAVQNSVFIDIKETTTTPLPVFSGMGIYALSNPYVSRSLTVEGLGKFGPSVFSGCTIGVFAHSTHATVENCNMVDTRQGIAVSGSRLRRVKALQNNISASEFGIGLFQNTPFKATIDNNHIIAHDPVSGQAIGIRVEENPYGVANYDYYWLKNNIVVMDKAREGIRLQGGRYLHAYMNTVEMTHDRAQDGLYLAGSADAWVRCNTVSGMSGSAMNQMSRGIFGIGNPSTLINCNSTDLTRQGISFDGLTDNSVVKGNYLNQHGIGLQIAQNGVIGIQEYAGNQWYGPFTDEGAKHFANNEITTSLSAFIVDASLSIGQPYDFMPQWEAVGQWFLDPPGNNGENTFYCLINEENACQENLNGPTNFKGEVDGLDEALAAGSTSFPQYTDALHWAGQRHLYRRLQEQNITPEPNTAIANFAASSPNSELGAFYNLENDLRELMKPNSSRETALYATQEATEMLISDLAANSRNLVAVNSTNDSLSLLAARASILEDIEENNDYADGLAEVSENSISSGISYLLQDNDALSDTAIYQFNEKTFHDIFLNTIAAGLYKFDSLQQVQLFAIAHQCPLAGGDAVFWARAAYALEDPAQTFNDSLLCTQSQSISRRPRQVPDSATFEVYPNPAADFVIIHTQQVADETGITIKLHDLLGNEQLKLTFTSGKQLHKLDTASLQPGMYLISMSIGKQSLGTKKVVILQ